MFNTLNREYCLGSSRHKRRIWKKYEGPPALPTELKKIKLFSNETKPYATIYVCNASYTIMQIAVGMLRASCPGIEGGDTWLVFSSDKCF